MLIIFKHYSKKKYTFRIAKIFWSRLIRHQDLRFAENLNRLHITWAVQNLSKDTESP